jgi:hypothetical protein
VTESAVASALPAYAAAAAVAAEEEKEEKKEEYTAGIDDKGGRAVGCFFLDRQNRFFYLWLCLNPFFLLIFFITFTKHCRFLQTVFHVQFPMALWFCCLENDFVL